jgi:hypothetical protein
MLCSGKHISVGIVADQGWCVCARSPRRGVHVVYDKWIVRDIYQIWLVIFIRRSSLLGSPRYGVM